MRDVLEDLLNEAIRCTARVKAEQQALQELRSIAANELGCSPKDFNKLLAEGLARSKGNL